ncbi:autotransporter outer membrane beta-barrel domain-containing protein, partial [Escherichia coli]
LKGDVADILPYASSLWVGDGATFVTGADQDIQSIDAISSGTIDISDGTVLRLTGQDTSVALNASLFNGDDSVSDQLVMNGNTAGNTTVVVNSITGIGEPTSTGIKVVDFAADPTQFQNNAQFSLAGSGYVNMGAYDYTLVEDN